MVQALETDESWPAVTVMAATFVAEVKTCHWSIAIRVAEKMHMLH